MWQYRFDGKSDAAVCCLVAAGLERAVTNSSRNQKIFQAIKESTLRALSSKQTARETLIKEGIYTAKGKLRAEFGGKSDKKATKAA